MTIGQICNRKVITVRRDATVQHAAQLMRQHHIGDVVVIENRQDQTVPLGILTDRDVVTKLVATELDSNVITAGDIMAKKLTSIKDSAGIFDAIKLMTAKGVRRLPVIDKHGDLVGIISLEDLLLLISHEFSALTKLVKHQQKSEVSN